MEGPASPEVDEMGCSGTSYNPDIMLSNHSASSRSSEDNPICWICLDISAPLVHPCRCPRVAHPKCLARWQLQSAGTRKETHCEFCDTALPDWKDSLTPKCASAAPALMNVNFDGRTYSFEVKPGPDGYSQFTASIRRAFNLPDDSELNITFTCDEPSQTTGSLLTLQGPGAYDAAVHCASVSAARRGASPFAEDGGPLSDEAMSIDGSPRHQQPMLQQPEPATPEAASSTLQVMEPDSTPNSKRRLSGWSKKLRAALDILSPRQGS